MDGGSPYGGFEVQKGRIKVPTSVLTYPRGFCASSHVKINNHSNAYTKQRGAHATVTLEG